jgi:putative transposase
MYRLLDEHGEVRERRAQLTHPPYQKPELLPNAPNQLWSWDITKLLGPAESFQPLRHRLDGDDARKRQLAKQLIEESCQKQHIQPG